MMASLKYWAKIQYARTLSLILQLFRKKVREDRTYVIFTMPRSGSTWFMDIVSSLTGTPSLFEPFNVPKIHNVYLKDLHVNNAFVPTESNVQKKRKIIERVLTGKLVSRWSLYHTTFRKYFSSDGLTIKTLNFNYFFPLIQDEYPLAKKLILLRHPGAVLESFIRSNRNQGFSQFTDISYLSLKLTERSSAFSNLEAYPEWERFIIFWCNEYDLLRDNMKDDDVLVVYYEQLVNYSEQIFEKLRDFVSVPDTSYEHFLSLHNKVSKTADKESAVKTDATMQWMNKLDSEMKEALQRYLDYYKITEYRIDEHMPSVEILK